MNKTKWSIVIFLAFSGAIWAQHERTLRGHAADTDGDGVVSQEEFLAQQTLIFHKLDINGDGVLAEEEMGRHRLRKRGHARSFSLVLFKMADSQGNADGVLDSVEWQNALIAIDGDGDGIVSPDALVSYLGKADAGDQGGMKMVLALDLDGDGEATTKELGELFGRWDHDADGLVVAKEIPRMKRKERLEQRKERHRQDPSDQ